MSKTGYIQETGPETTEQVWEVAHPWRSRAEADAYAARMCVWCGQPRFKGRDEQTAARGMCRSCEAAIYPAAAEERYQQEAQGYTRALGYRAGADRRQVPPERITGIRSGPVSRILASAFIP